MFDFKEKFKNRPTIELLQMLENPEKYQPDALTAAKEIVEKRKQEDPESFLEANRIMLQEEVLAEPYNTKKQEGNEIDIWQEDEIEKQDKATIRNNILTIFIAYTAINIMFLAEVLRTSISNSLRDGSFVNWMAISAQIAFAIVGSIFFIKREKTGWIFFVFDFIFRSIFCVKLIMLSVSYPGGKFSYALYYAIIPLVVFCIALYRMTRVKFMSQYKVSLQTFLWTAGASVLFAACIVYIQRFYQ